MFNSLNLSNESELSRGYTTKNHIQVPKEKEKLSGRLFAFPLNLKSESCRERKKYSKNLNTRAELLFCWK